MLDREIWQFMESATSYVVLWIFAFTILTTIRIVRRIRGGVARVADNPVLTEFAGLLLTLLPSICFVWALAKGDWLSALLLAWWGPGFLLSIGLVVAAKARQVEIDWYPWRNVISWLCKLSYLAYVALFAWLGLFGMIFAFSAWIINDQYEKAFMSLDADRLRRTFDDFWLFRLAYPAGLLIPYFAEGLEHRLLYGIYGSVLLVLWLVGVRYVRRSGKLYERPDDTTLLRNMAYFKKRVP
jgi:hypothetical protein